MRSSRRIAMPLPFSTAISGRKIREVDQLQSYGAYGEDALNRLAEWISSPTTLAALGEVTVDRVVAQVGLATDEPPAERRIRIVEDLLRCPVPVDGLRLLGPKAFRVVERPAMEVFIAHLRLPPAVEPEG